MRRVRYNVAASLDGFIASPDGSTEWIVHDESIDFAALFAEFDTFIMGRKTYETLQAMGEQNPLRAKHREDVVIVSRGMRAQDYPDVSVLNTDPVPYVRELKDRDGKDIWLFGGGQLARCLLEARLVDSVEVAIMPVLLGNGVKMVAGTDGQQSGWKLKLDSVRKLDTGILMCKYYVSED